MSSSEMIPCDQVIARLWEYVDGELDADGEERMERHLDACARCFPEYDFRRAYRTFVARVGPQGAPADVRQRVFLAILEEERGGTTGGGGREGVVGRVRRWLGRLLPGG